MDYTDTVEAGIIAASSIGGKQPIILVSYSSRTRLHLENKLMNMQLIKKIVLSALITIFLSTMSTAATLVMELESEQPNVSANPPKKAAAKKPADVAKAPEPRKLGSVGQVVAEVAQIHKSRSRTSRVFSSVPKETALAVVDTKDGWYGVMMSNGVVGWVDAKSIVILDYDIVSRQQPTSRHGGSGRDSIADLLENDIIKTAASYKGVRYVFGGENPRTGMDCSAYLRSVFAKFGYKLPRTARTQANVGQSVPFDQLQPGDRLYFSCTSKQIDHCGIYAGNGYFIHCSSGKKGVAFDSLSNDFFGRNLVIAKR